MTKTMLILILVVLLSFTEGNNLSENLNKWRHQEKHLDNQISNLGHSIDTLPYNHFVSYHE